MRITTTRKRDLFPENPVTVTSNTINFFGFDFLFVQINPSLMSTYENKGSSRKGNNSKKGQAHQNTTSWKANKNSKKSREIAALPVYGLCQRCTDVILWRKKYKKYKPLTTVKRW
jgi:hypothetical protein